MNGVRMRFQNLNISSMKMEIMKHILYLQDQYQFCYRAALEYLSSFDQIYPETQPQGMAVMELGV